MTERPALRDLLGVEIEYWNSLRVHSDGTVVPTDSFGSLLGPLVVELMLATAGPALSSAGHVPARRLLAPGSHLGHASAGSTVWGAGAAVATAPTGSDRRDLDVRSVRGPWSAALLTSRGDDVPAVYGDPVLLLGRLLPDVPDLDRQEGLRLFVPGHGDAAEWAGRADELSELGLTVISPAAPLLLTLSAIARAELVVGSSLQAVAVADAYGVPARLVRATDDLAIEHRDYLLGTGRPGTIIAADAVEALKLGAHEAPEFDADLLLATFPWDLWGVDDTPMASATRFSAGTPVMEKWYERVTGATDSAQIAAEYSANAQRAIDSQDVSDEAIEVLCGVRRLVLPDLPRGEFDQPARDLLFAIDHGASEAAVRSLVERGPGSDAARLIAWRDLGQRALASLDVTLSRAVGPLTRVRLELSGRPTAVVEELRLFEVNQGQSELNVHVLLPLVGLRRSDEISLRIVDEDGERLVEVDTSAVALHGAPQEVNA